MRHKSQLMFLHKGVSFVALFCLVAKGGCLGSPGSPLRTMVNSSTRNKIYFLIQLILGLIFFVSNYISGFGF